MLLHLVEDFLVEDLCAFAIVLLRGVDALILQVYAGIYSQGGLQLMKISLIFLMWTLLGLIVALQHVAPIVREVV